MNYYVLYKPFNVLSQFTDDSGRRTLAEFFNFPKDVYSVGRLDYDSEGLIIITNDNYLKKILNDPKSNHKKTYIVQVEGIISGEAIKAISEGIEISHNNKIYLTRKCIVNKIENEPELPLREPPIRYRKNIPTSFINIILSEGKNRQIRKMTAKVGFPTLRIIRTAIEKIHIDKLLPGDVIELNKNSIYKLLNI